MLRFDYWVIKLLIVKLLTLLPLLPQLNSRLSLSPSRSVYTKTEEEGLSFG